MSTSNLGTRMTKTSSVPSSIFINLVARHRLHSVENTELLP